MLELNEQKNRSHWIYRDIIPFPILDTLILLKAGEFFLHPHEKHEVARWWSKVSRKTGAQAMSNTSC